MAISKTQRLLDLLALLTRHRFPITRSQIMEGVPEYQQKLESGVKPESVRTMFIRDKDDLLALGIPLETVEVPAEKAEEQAAYRLSNRDFYLPYLKLLKRGWEVERREDAPRRSGAVPQFSLELDDLQAAREAVAPLRDVPDFPLASEAASALRKLSFDLGDLRSGPGRPHAGALVAAADPEEVSRRTDLLSDAMRRGKEVTFTYTGAYRPGTEERRVRPYGLLFKFNHWYLVGFDVNREAVRVFRLSRMTELAVNSRRPKTPDFTLPEDFSMDPWRTAEPWSMPADDAEPLSVAVRFRFPQSMLAERRGQGVLESREPDGSQVRRFEVRQTDAFLRWLLTRQGEAEPLEPPEVADAFRRLARRVAHLYTDVATGGEL